MTIEKENRSLTRFAWLSIGAAVVTIALKSGAYAITGSVGLLSDALESCVNLATAVVALIVLILAGRPPDDEHAYGHTKAEYFSSGFEGAMILFAAGSIAYVAVTRLLQPQPLEEVGLGLLISVVASVINLGVALVLRQAARRHRSIVLEADSKHLMTDVWTTAGVIIGVAAVAVTGWLWLDPLLALAVAANILVSGVHLLRRSAMGLLDTALPADELDKIDDVFERYRLRGIQFHSLRTRQAGTRRFLSVHVLVPGAWSVQQAHDLSEQIEAELRQEVANLTMVTHMEPVEDPISLLDTQLDRRVTAA